MAGWQKGYVQVCSPHASSKKYSPAKCRLPAAAVLRVDQCEKILDGELHYSTVLLLSPEGPLCSVPCKD